MATDLIGSIKEKQQRIIALKREILALEGELRVVVKFALGLLPVHQVCRLTGRTT